jgi:outer membrane protein
MSFPVLLFALASAAGTAQAQTLTFDQAVAATLASSSRIKAAEHALQAQVEKRRGSWSNVGPKVNVGYNDVYFEDAQTARMLVAVEDGNGVYRDVVLRGDRSQVGNVTVTQPLTGAATLVEVARNEGTIEDVKALDLERAKQDATFQTGEAFLRAKAAMRLLAIAETSVNAAASSLKDATALERAGRMNRGDVLKLELAVSEARARVAQARAGADIALASLRESMGLTPSAPLTLDDQLPAAKIPPIPPVEDAQRRALEARPDVKQARLGKDLAGFGSKVAYSQFSPSINAFVKFERNFGEVSGFGGGEKDTRTYGIMASWEIWNNGASVFAVRQAAEESQRAEAASQLAEQGVRLDVFQTVANLRAAQESLTLAETAVKQAEEAYRIEQVRFRSGARSATDVILAESSQAGARGRLVTAVTDLIVWNLRLQKALGASRPTL